MNQSFELLPFGGSAQPELEWDTEQGGEMEGESERWVAGGGHYGGVARAGGYGGYRGYGGRAGRVGYGRYGGRFGRPGFGGIGRAHLGYGGHGYARPGYHHTGYARGGFARPAYARGYGGVHHAYQRPAAYRFGVGAPGYRYGRVAPALRVAAPGIAWPRPAVAYRGPHYGRYVAGAAPYPAVLAVVGAGDGSDATQAPEPDQAPPDDAVAVPVVPAAADATAAPDAAADPSTAQELNLHGLECHCPRCCRQAGSGFEVMPFGARRAARRTGLPFSDADENRLTMELLSVTNEAEMEQFLGGMFKGIWNGVKKIAAPLGGALKSVAKAALPMVGGALGSFIPIPGVGTALGTALGGAVSRALEMEFGGMQSEQQEFESARRFVRMAGTAAQLAGQGDGSPQALRAALEEAARRHLPYLAAARQEHDDWRRAERFGERPRW